MKILLKEARKIGDSYPLGNIVEVKLISGGLANYNFELKNEKESFIARFSSFILNKKGLLRLKAQIKAILFLEENGFEYDLPIPIKSKNGEFIRYLNKKPYWICKKIKGNFYSDMSKVDKKQLAKLIAEYHKIIIKMPLQIKKDGYYDYTGLKRDIDKVEKLLKSKKQKDELDQLMERNLDVLKKGFKRISKINFGQERVFVHSDWYVGNLAIDKKGHITGLIDFDLFEIAPAIKDIACAIQLYCFSKDNKWIKEEAREFVAEYEKYRQLDKFDKYHLKDLVIRESCYASIYFYLKNKKANPSKKYFLLKWSLDSIKNLLEDINKKEYF